MKRYAGSLALVVAFLSLSILAPQACGQTAKIEIGAGTPEDHDLQTISSEPDAAKKLAMYLDFVQKYSSNPAAVAYGNWQLEQAYQAALTCGELEPVSCRTARYEMKTLAIDRNPASASAERCSALPCPNWCVTSAGRAATRTAKNVSSAATRSVPE